MNRNLIFTLGAELIGKIAPFILIPVLTHYILPEDFAILSYLMISIPFLVIIISFGTIGSIPVWFYKYSDEFKLHFSSLLVFYFVIGLLIVLFTFLFSYIYSQPLFLLGSIIGSLSVFFQVFTVYFQSCKDFKTLFLFQLTYAFFTLFITFYFLSYFESGMYGRIYAWLISLLLSCSIFYVFLKKDIELLSGFSFRAVKAALVFGLPLILHQVSAWLLNSIDRFWIGELVGKTELGIYSVATQFGIIVNILAVALNRYFQPISFEEFKINGCTIKQYVKNFKSFSMMFVPLSTISVLFVYLVLPYILSPDYSGVDFIFLFMSLGFLFNGLYLVSANALFFLENTKSLSLMTFAMASFHIVSSYIFIYFLKINGALFSMVLTWFLMLFFSILLSIKKIGEHESNI